MGYQIYDILRHGGRFNAQCFLESRTMPKEEKLRSASYKHSQKSVQRPDVGVEAIRRRDTKGEPVREIAGTFNVSHSTIARLKA